MISVHNLEDVKSLIEARIEESQTLDYKEKLGNNSDISKDVCAFANSDGGLIIYGVQAKDRIPIGFTWIVPVGIEEKINNIVSSTVRPSLEVGVERYANPEVNTEAIFVLKVMPGPDAPYMSQDSRYYKRHGSISIPMDNDEVRVAMYGKGRYTALKFEILFNINLNNKTLELIRGIMEIPPQSRRGVAFIPFNIDAWNSIISSGALSTFSEEQARKLVETYMAIHQINNLIDCLKVESANGIQSAVVHTPIFEESYKIHGTWLPAIIQQKCTTLVGLLFETTSILKMGKT